MQIYTEDEVLLSVNNVNKEYNGKLILKNLNATVKDIHVIGQVTGQIVAMIGPSGIGKSTAFRIIAGLETPTSGSVILRQDTNPVKAGQVGVVAQSYPLFAHRTVMSNLMLAARKVYPEKIAREKVITYLNDFDLFAEIDHYPAQLSGGQRQRCAILQQILVGSKLILMDEPFSGLDPVAKNKIQNLIKKIANIDELNTIIVVTHDIQAAAELADHIWIMGRERDAQGRALPGASIIRTDNLIDMGFGIRNRSYV